MLFITVIVTLLYYIYGICNIKLETVGYLDDSFNISQRKSDRP